MGSTLSHAERLNDGPPSATLSVIELTRDGFRFENFPHPEQFFQGRRPLRIIASKPPLVTYHDVIYTPAVRGGPKERLGCLYDAAGRRIPEALTRRNRSDDIFNTDPEQYEGRADDLPVYDRPVLYMGHIRPHFGHFLMESLAGWWGLTEELGDIDRYLFHVYNPALLERPFVKACLEAMQIGPEQILFFDRPMRLKQVIVPEATFQLKSHAYTKYRDTLNRISHALGAAVPAAQQTDQPVYLSKTQNQSGVRRYIGEERVEAFLAERGARIVHPQQLPFAEQFRVVNQHRHVIGFQGSQMSNLVGALEPRNVIYFTDQQAWAGLFMLTRLYGNDATFVNVSEDAHKLHTLYNSAMRRMLGKKTQFEGFDKAHQVDYERTIAWLKTTGLV